jgi:hypothetical protein
VDFARKYFAASDDVAGREALASALRLDPRYAGARRLRLLETLLQEIPSDDPAAADQLARRLEPVLRVSPGELRRARARVAMRSYFRLQRQAPLEARRHLWRGVRLDPRWLANRGVLRFVARHGLGAR